MNHYKAFAATYATQHAVPALVKRQPTDDPPTLWKVMHHPEWEFEPHKEGDEFYKEGEYWVCDGKPSTPSAITSRIKEEATGGGHRFVMRPRSIFGKKGKRLKTGCSRNLDELRFGKVTGWTLPDDTRLQKDVGWFSRLSGTLIRHHLTSNIRIKDRRLSLKWGGVIKII